MDNQTRLGESIQRFDSILTPDEIQKILTVQDEPLPTGIRLNSLKRDPQAAIKDLASRYGWQVEPVPFCENAWTLQKTEFSPGTTIEHRLGQYYLQDAASMVPVSLFDIQSETPLILDMAASPGGKTTHLIDRTRDKGFVIANDGSKGRIPALRSVLSTWGGINLAITNFPGESFGAWYPETFDMVLLDAPCSMENLRPTPNRPMRETTIDERLRLKERQVQLLTSGLRALKTGGQIVYATCSLAPEEDEAVIDALLKTEQGLVVEDVSQSLLFKTPGLTHFINTNYDSQMVHALRLWPHLTGMSGFFCALITKTKPIPAPEETPPSRDFSKTDLERADTQVEKQVFNQIFENYGLEMQKILSDYKLSLLTRYDQIFLIPERYLSHFLTLPYAYIGMSVGRWLGNEFKPSHEFISRFGHQFTRGKIKIEDSAIEQWIAGRDIRHPDTDLKLTGQYLLVTDRSGRNLGMGKLLPKRLRNMLPR